MMFIFANQMSVSGPIAANGQSGESGAGPGDNAGAGGGGAGGSIPVKASQAALGTNFLLGTGGSGGTSRGGVGIGGNGGAGRIRVEACSVSGGTKPPTSVVERGHYFCP